MLAHLHQNVLPLVLTGICACSAKKKLVKDCSVNMDLKASLALATNPTDHLIGFSQIGYMPMNVDLLQLDDGDGIESTLMRHHADWHRTCRLKFSQLKLERLQKKSEEGTSTTASVSTRSNKSTNDPAMDNLFFCDKPAGSEGFHNASTYNIDPKVQRCALELEDTNLLAKLAPGDMIALEAKYHLKCLTNLYNRARALENADAEKGSNEHFHGIAFAELVSFMEELRREESIAPIFKLTDLSYMYKTRLVLL